MSTNNKIKPTLSIMTIGDRQEKCGNPCSFGSCEIALWKASQGVGLFYLFYGALWLLWGLSILFGAYRYQNEQYDWTVVSIEKFNHEKIHDLPSIPQPVNFKFYVSSEVVFCTIGNALLGGLVSILGLILFFGSRKESRLLVIMYCIGMGIVCIVLVSHYIFGKFYSFAVKSPSSTNVYGCPPFACDVQSDQLPAPAIESINHPFTENITTTSTTTTNSSGFVEHNLKDPDKYIRGLFKGEMNLYLRDRTGIYDGIGFGFTKTCYANLAFGVWSIVWQWFTIWVAYAYFLELGRTSSSASSVHDVLHLMEGALDEQQEKEAEARRKIIHQNDRGHSVKKPAPKYGKIMHAVLQEDNKSESNLQS